MDMPVDKECGLLLFDESGKAFKAFVAGVISVMYKSWRGMADDDICLFAVQEFQPQAAQDLFHIAFTVLIDTAVIPT